MNVSVRVCVWAHKCAAFSVYVCVRVCVWDCVCAWVCSIDLVGCSVALGHCSLFTWPATENNQKRLNKNK